MFLIPVAVPCEVRGGHDYRRHANPTREDWQQTTRTFGASSAPTLH